MRDLQKGFTIIEMTIYIGLMSILILVLTRIFISALDTQVESESVTNVQQDGRFILARLNYDISLASSINTPASMGAQENSISLVRNGQTITYSLTNGDLIRTDSQGSARINYENVDVEQASFQRIGNTGGKPTIVVNLRLSSMANMGTLGETDTFRSVIGTR